MAWQAVRIIRSTLRPATASMRLSSSSSSHDAFKSIKYAVEKHIALITLSRPKRLNAIDENMPFDIESAVKLANNNKHVKCIVVQGEGENFCSGYDLKKFAEQFSPMNQKPPYDPYQDYRFMYRCTEAYMSLWRSHKPTIAKIRGVCIGGGTDIALSCDVIFAEKISRIGYPPTRVWGCPTTAHWFYRLGIEQAKRILFTGKILSGEEAEKIGLIGSSHSKEELDAAVKEFTDELRDVPTNQLFFQKLVVNSSVEQMGIGNMQKLASLLDGLTRHTPEGIDFQKRCQAVGFKRAVLERDAGKMGEWDGVPKNHNAEIQDMYVP